MYTMKTIVVGELMENVWQVVLQNQRFTILELSGQFPQMSHSLLQKIVSLWQEIISTMTVRYKRQ